MRGAWAGAGGAWGEVASSNQTHIGMDGRSLAFLGFLRILREFTKDFLGFYKIFKGK